MSTQTMLSIKIDRELKKKAQEVAHVLGVSLNAVINQNIKEFINERKVTFVDPPMFNRKTQKILDKIIADSRANKNIIGPFDSMEKMIESLDS